MTTLHVISGAVDDESRAELVLGGDLVIFKDVEPLGDLCAAAEAMVTEVGDDVGAAADGPAGHERRAATITELRRRFREDLRARTLFRSALESVGVDPERTSWDRLFLRVQTPVAAEGDSGAGSLAAHRDTWSSNVYEQINWWTPIRPLTAERTIAFYPAYWSRPIANTSAHWDLELIRRARSQGEHSPVPVVPEPTEAVDVASELRIVIQPGDLLCFSGAHLHASVPNVSTETRLSIEVRTVNTDDRQRGRHAPNLDGRAPRVPHEWFEPITGTAASS